MSDSNHPSIERIPHHGENVMFKLTYKLYQPWSTFVMHIPAPPPIIESMIKITDKILREKENEDGYSIPLDMLVQEGASSFFLNMTSEYVKLADKQALKAPQGNIISTLESIKVVLQKDHEHKPLHSQSGLIRPGATVLNLSAIMYLKIPDPTYMKDNLISFMNNISNDHIWPTSVITCEPKVGDLFIFPANQNYQEYPFRTVDGKGTRRSVSLNMNFSYETLPEDAAVWDKPYPHH